MANPTLRWLQHHLLYPHSGPTALGWILQTPESDLNIDRELLTHEVLLILCYDYITVIWPWGRGLRESFFAAIIDFCYETSVRLDEHYKNYKEGNETPAVSDGVMLLVNFKYLTFSGSKRWQKLRDLQPNQNVFFNTLPEPVINTQQLFLIAAYMEVYSKYEAQHSNQEPVSQS